MTNGVVSLRAVKEGDLSDVVALIRELADFENLTHQVQVRPEDLARHLFGERPVIECVVAEQGSEVIAFALFFVNFSTFLGKPGLYLEDLYVQPQHRRSGVGTRLLAHLAGLAVERDYGRFEWSVLDWNTPAIEFYESLGAKLHKEWLRMRVEGEALSKLASRV